MVRYRWFRHSTYILHSPLHGPTGIWIKKGIKQLNLLLVPVNKRGKIKL